MSRRRSWAAVAIFAASYAGCIPDRRLLERVEAGALPPSRAPDAGDASTTPVPIPSVGDGGTCSGGALDAGTGVTTCPVVGTLDHKSVPYKPPRKRAGGCTEGAIDALKALAASNPKATMADVQVELIKQSQECAFCVFAADAETWSPVVEKCGTLYLNGGGCMEIVSGSSDCGRAWQQFDQCVEYACSGCTTPAEQESCGASAPAEGGPCGAATTDLRAACGASNLASYIATCFPSGTLNLEGPIRTQCF